MVVFTIILALLFVLSACIQPTAQAPEPTKKAEIQPEKTPEVTLPPPDKRYLCKSDDKGGWDCSDLAKRRAIFTNVPPELQVYAYEIPADVQEILLSKDLQEKYTITSLVADFRFYENNQPFEGKLSQEVGLQLAITKEDRVQAEKLQIDIRKLTIGQSFPLKDGKGWKPWAEMRDATFKNDAEYIFATFTSWAIDPPSSPGVGT